MTNKDTEKEIDILQAITHFWKRRRFIYVSIFVGIIVGIVISISTPKEYVSIAKLAPEYHSGLANYGSLSATNINIGNVGLQNDVSLVNLYADVASSFPFLIKLLPEEVTTEDNISLNFYDYMCEHQEIAWWNHILALPSKLLRSITEKEVKSQVQIDENQDSTCNRFNISTITPEQHVVVEILKSRVIVLVDVQTMVLFVKVKMQDPYVATKIAQITTENLQEYIYNYRTQKIKSDLAYSQKAFDEAKLKYESAQKTYAEYIRSNYNATSAKIKIEEERLEKEMNLVFDVYSNLAKKLEETKLRMQEETIKYEILEPALRPIKSIGIGAMIIIFISVCLFGFGSVVYISIKDKLICFQSSEK